MANAYISVCKMLILHSPPVLPASLQCKLGNNSVEIAYFTQNWLVGSPPQDSRAFFQHTCNDGEKSREFW